MDNAQLVAVLPEERIQTRVRELAQELDSLYGDAPLVMVCVLKGGFMFFSDLCKNMRKPYIELDFVRISSYGDSTVSSRNVVISKDLEIDISGKHVLVVEDIIDTGHSMDFLLKTLQVRNPKSLRLAVMVNKKERREVKVQPDFVGFTVNDGFIVGYGLDYAEKYRNLPAIYALVN